MVPKIKALTVAAGALLALSGGGAVHAAPAAAAENGSKRGWSS